MADETERARTEAASWLILLEDDPEDAEQQARFRAWLAAAPGNRAAWRSVSRTGSLLASAAAPQPAGLARTASPPRGTRRQPGRRPALAASAAALAACLVLALAPTISLRLRADQVTGTGEIRTVALADGTTVRLGPGSALKVALTPAGREVELLAGEASFDVVHDAAHPFRVRAGELTATDLGTRFDVEIRDGGSSVAVNQGHVRVDSATGTFDLHPGDWVRLNPDGAAERASGLPDELTAGPSPRIAARNRPVAEVLDAIRPWYAGEILVTDRDIARRPVTGVFDARDPARALEALVGPQGGRVTRITPWLLVVSRD